MESMNGEHLPEEANGCHSPKKKLKTYKQEAGKGIWMITYAAGCQDITSVMLHENSVMCDECYTVTWRESKYTLIHIRQSKKTRLSAMTRVLNKLYESFGIRGSSITGYETLYFNEKDETDVTDHPAFKRMVELVNTGGDLNVWLADGDVMSNKKGLLWKHISIINPKQKTHGQLVQQVKELTHVIEETKSVRTENEVLKATLIIMENDLVDAHRTISSYDSRNEKLFRDLVKKTEECTALKQRLIQNNLDHTLPTIV